MAHHEPATSNSITQDSGDGCADALAAVAIIALVVSCMVFWLHSMPT